MTSLWFLCLLNVCPAPKQVEGTGVSPALVEWIRIAERMDCSGPACEASCYDSECGPSPEDLKRASKAIQPNLREAIDFYEQQLVDGCVPQTLPVFLRTFGIRTTRLRNALVELGKQRYSSQIEGPLLHFLQGSRPSNNAWLLDLAGQPMDSISAHQSMERLLTYAFQLQADPPGLLDKAAVRFHRALLSAQPERIWDAVVRRWPESQQHPERMNLARFLGRGVGQENGVLEKALALVGKDPLLRAAVLVAAIRAAPARSAAATELVMAWLDELSTPEGSIGVDYATTLGLHCEDPLCGQRNGKENAAAIEETLAALDPKQLSRGRVMPALRWLFQYPSVLDKGRTAKVHPGWIGCFVDQLDSLGKPRHEVLKVLRSLGADLVSLYPVLSRPLDDRYQSELVEALAKQLPTPASEPGRETVRRMVRGSADLHLGAWGSLLYQVGERREYVGDLVAELTERLPGMARSQYRSLVAFGKHLTAQLDPVVKNRFAEAARRYWQDRPQDPFLRLGGLALVVKMAPGISGDPHPLFDAVPSVPLANPGARREVTDLLREVMLDRLRRTGKEATLAETRSLTRGLYGRSAALDEILREVEKTIASYQPFCFSC